MTEEIVVTTQAEMDAVPADFKGLIIVKGNVNIRVTGSSSPRIEAWDSSSPSGKASPGAILSCHYSTPVRPEITGNHAIILEIPNITTPEQWCAYYGVVVKDGAALVYKAVRDDYRSAHGVLYAPGGPAEATDWDGGEAECGGGLHFSPSPAHARYFDGEAARYVVCAVALSDMRAPSPSDQYPHKIKARRCNVLRECTEDGEEMKS